MCYMLRRRGEKARVVACDGAPRVAPSAAVLAAALGHGDLVLDGGDTRRGATSAVWVVIERRTATGPVLELLDAADEGGNPQIVDKISDLIKDPLEFYAEAIESDPGIVHVDLDPDVHQELLRRYTRGRPVHRSRRVWWSRADGLEVYLPPSAGYPHGGTAPLCDATPQWVLDEAED